MKPSQIVLELAAFASAGKYNITPKEARSVNDLFDRVAELINQMEEAEETTDVSETE